MTVMSRWINGEVVAVSQEEIDAIMAAPVSKADLDTLAANTRWQVMSGGILFDGHPIPTDDVGRGLVTGAYVRSQGDATVTKRWQVSSDPVIFVTFSNAQILALGHAVDSLVQGAFDVLDEVAAGIASGAITTKAQVFDAFAAVPRVYTTPGA